MATYIYITIILEKTKLKSLKKFSIVGSLRYKWGDLDIKISNGCQDIGGVIYETGMYIGLCNTTCLFLHWLLSLRTTSTELQSLAVAAEIVLQDTTLYNVMTPCHLTPACNQMDRMLISWPIRW